MIRRFLAVVALMGAMPMAAFAWGGYNQVTVVELTVYQAGRGATPGVLVKVSGVTPGDNEGCAQSGTGYAWIDFSSSTMPDGKTVYTSLLAAQMAGKLVNVGLNGCSSGGYPLVYGVNTYP